MTEVHYVYQTLDAPNGDPMIAEDHNETLIATPLKISLPHTRIDESPTWWGIVKSQLTTFVNGN